MEDHHYILSRNLIHTTILRKRFVEVRYIMHITFGKVLINKRIIIYLQLDAQANSAVSLYFRILYNNYSTN